MKILFNPLLNEGGIIKQKFQSKHERKIIKNKNRGAILFTNLIVTKNQKNV